MTKTILEIFTKTTFFIFFKKYLERFRAIVQDINCLIVVLLPTSFNGIGQTEKNPNVIIFCLHSSLLKSAPEQAKIKIHFPGWFDLVQPVAQLFILEINNDWSVIGGIVFISWNMIEFLAVSPISSIGLTLQYGEFEGISVGTDNLHRLDVLFDGTGIPSNSNEDEARNFHFLGLLNQIQQMKNIRGGRNGFQSYTKWFDIIYHNHFSPYMSRELDRRGTSLAYPKLLVAEDLDSFLYPTILLVVALDVIDELDQKHRR
ncbi:hypothetical protein ACJX0J_010920 [Zea mays]